jgi:hypothetical protein
VKPGCVQRRYSKALINMTAENNPNIMRPISIETTRFPSRPGTRKMPQPAQTVTGFTWVKKSTKQQGWQFR